MIAPPPLSFFFIHLSVQLLVCKDLDVFLFLYLGCVCMGGIRGFMRDWGGG